MTTPIKILLAEDDTNLGKILQEYLQMKGYEATLCRDGIEAFEKFKKYPYDIGILDVMMPKLDGFGLAKEIRSTNKTLPLIFLTAKSMKEDTLEGFRVGGDDYITKPFSMEELLMRIQAILRRTQIQSEQIAHEFTSYTLGKYTFNYEKQELVYNNKSHKLTSKEGELLKLLCLNKNHTLERKTALKLIWQDDSYFNARSMDVYITKLRKLLKEDEQIEIINVHGTGFKLLVLE